MAGGQVGAAVPGGREGGGRWVGALRAGGGREESEYKERERERMGGQIEKEGIRKGRGKEEKERERKEEWERGSDQ